MYSYGQDASRFQFGASEKGLPPNCPPHCPAHGTPGTADLEPLLYELGIDIYWAGHVHFVRPLRLSSCRVAKLNLNL